MTSFSLTRVPTLNPGRRVVADLIEDVTPTYRRIRLVGDFAGFSSLGADDHLRVFFVPADFTATSAEADPEGFATLREQPSREYTPVSWDADALVLDFVLHGDGPASTWAQHAVPGSVAVVGGPRGAMVIEGQPDWWLLAGDRTALPAIRRHLLAVAPGTPVDVVLLAEDESDEQELASAGELTVTWVRSLDELVTRLRDAPERAGDGFAFVAAEQSIVKPVREILADRGIDLSRAVVKGYWKRGEAEYHSPRPG
jgi:NADPH-dependent ferric siderophore reductase